MQLNETKQTVAEATRTTNHEGGEAFRPADPRLALYKRTSNQLLEDSYYEDEIKHLQAVVERFDAAAAEDPESVLKLPAYARQEMHLRDIPQVLPETLVNFQLNRSSNHGQFHRRSLRRR